MKLVAIGVDGQARGQVTDQAHPVVFQPGILGGDGDDAGQQHLLKLRRGLFGLAVFQYVARQGGGATQGALQPGQGLGHQGVGRAGQTLRRHLGRGQHVA
ncbi:hypothetical protein D3C80_981730 [compost metagenome]